MSQQKASVKCTCNELSEIYDCKKDCDAEPPIKRSKASVDVLEGNNNHVMTKQERLQELKVQDQLYKVFDKYFDAGWREFVNDIKSKNDISNLRIFKILSTLKGNDFVSDLINLMGKKNKSARLILTKKPKGILLKDNRFQTIPEFMINKYPSVSYREGELFVQVTKDRWVYFVY